MHTSVLIKRAKLALFSPLCEIGHIHKFVTYFIFFHPHSWFQNAQKHFCILKIGLPRAFFVTQGMPKSKIEKMVKKKPNFFVFQDAASYCSSNLGIDGTRIWCKFQPYICSNKKTGFYLSILPIFAPFWSLKAGFHHESAPWLQKSYLADIIYTW